MPRRFVRALSAIILAAIALAGAALAKDGDDKTWFVSFVESLLSTPDRTVSISGLDGVFSANPTIGRVTVADRQGIWLELDGVAMTWNRSALFSRTIEIESLKADRVVVSRKPAAAGGKSSGGMSAPPLAIDLKSLSLPEVTLAEPVVGAAAQLAASGSAVLHADQVSAELNVDRQDRAGSLALDLKLEPKANVLTADLKLEEPAGGILADMLDLNGRPAVSLNVSGTGALDDWQGTVAAAAGDTKVVGGTIKVLRATNAYRVAADLDAALAPLLPPDYAALLAGDAKLALDLTRGDDGTLTLTSATLRSDGVDLAAKGVVGADRVPRSADLSLTLGQAGRAALPFVPGGLSVGSLSANAGLDAGSAAPWHVTVKAEGVEGDFGTVGALALDASGKAENLAEASSRGTSFRMEATMTGVAAADAKLAAALGPNVKASATGSWSAGAPAKIDDLAIVLNGATVGFRGTTTAAALNGDFEASIVDLGRFSGFAGRILAGSLDAKASGSAGTAGTFDLTLDGAAKDLALGVPALDPLLAGATRISGGVARSDAGLRFDHLALANANASAALDGTLASPDVDMNVTANVADLSLANPRAEGAAKLTAHVTGTLDAPRVEAEAGGDRIALMGRPLTDAKARFSGVVAGPATSGEASISGMLADAPVRGSAKLAAGENGARVLDDLAFAVGKSQVGGSLTIGGDGLMNGNLSLVSPDLSKVAPLFLVDASGMMRAEIALDAEGGQQNAAFNGTATDVAYQNIALKSADIAGTARDLFKAPQIEGKFTLSDLRTGGLTIVNATGTAQRSGDSTAFKVDAALADGRANLDGTLAPADGGLAVGLKSFAFKRTGIDVALAAPTTIGVSGGAAHLDNLTIKAGAGSATLAGTVGSKIDAKATLNAIPAALVNAFAPDLGAEGTVSGVVEATGSASAPNASFDLTLAGTSVAASRNAGLGALGVTARGTLADRKVALRSEIFGADGMALTVGGTIGTAKDGPLALKITGSVPLSLGNRQLASRGAALQGALNVDVAVAGTTASPTYSGKISAANGGFVDPESGIVLKNMVLAASLAGNRLTLDRLEAASGDGNVAATGTIGLDPKAGLPVDLAFKIRRARYVDGTLIAARFDADLTMTGKLAEAPAIAGKVTLDRTEITVPEKLPGDAIAVDVKHVAPSPPVAKTLAIVKTPEKGARSAPSTGPSGIQLEVAVEAPQRIFIRGRGLDAEFGGRLTLHGSLSGLVASGGFDLVRGRLDILTKRITFDRGTITFAGDLDPIVDFSGTTKSGDTSITVSVTGRASDPQLNFSSSPELPQDEIMAQLIFDKSIGDLSPVQIARLAAAVSELSGGSGGLLGQLRATTGLDDLDVVTDSEGQTSVAAGRYISNNVYLGVEQGTAASSSRVTIDLDVTKDVKARAGVGADGDSSLGLFFEHEY